MNIQRGDSEVAIIYRMKLEGTCFEHELASAFVAYQHAIVHECLCQF